MNSGQFLVTHVRRDRKAGIPIHHFCDVCSFHRLMRLAQPSHTAPLTTSTTVPHREHGALAAAGRGASGARQRAGCWPRRLALLAHSQRCRKYYLPRFDLKYSGWVFCDMAGAVQPFARNPAEIRFSRFALTRKSSLPTLLAERTCTAPVASTANSTSSMNSCQGRRV